MHLIDKDKINIILEDSGFMAMLCILLKNTEYSLFLCLKKNKVRNKSPPSIKKSKK